MASSFGSDDGRSQATNDKVTGRNIWQTFREEGFQLNFYRVHMAYFVITISVSSLILWASGLTSDSEEYYGDDLHYIDALFLCTSAMTASVNLNVLSAFQQAVLGVLIIMGNVVTVSTSVVAIRRHFFRKKMADVVKHSKAGRKVKKDIDEEEANLATNAEPPASSSIASGNRQSHDSSNATLRRRRQGSVQPNQTSNEWRRHHHTGFGFFPAPWESSAIRKAFHWPFQRIGTQVHEIEHHYFSFEPDLDHKGRIHSLNEHERQELGGVEYRALKVLMVLLLVYVLAWVTLGIIFLVPYSYRTQVKSVVTTTQTGYLNPGWWAFFLTLSTYGNCGMNLLNSNFQMFKTNYYLLIIIGALDLVGNTQFPVMLRFWIWALSKMVPTQSGLHHSLSFLLHHPRRCFIYLFPSTETWYLFGIQIGIEMVSWVLFETLNLGIPYVMDIQPGTRTIVGLFTSIGLRSGGFYAVAMGLLAPALQVFYIIVMFISSFPIIMALRQTNTYEEQSIGLDETDTHEKGHLSTHLQSQLAYDLWFMIAAWFLICIVERTALMESHPGFSIFNILFEVTSGYGTVGLTTGVPYDSYSLSGAFHTLSKVIMLFVMVRGRHRGLPLAIDRSILIPGGELLHQMDEEYNHRGGFSKKDEKEVRRVQGNSGAQETNLEPQRGRGEEDDSSTDLVFEQY
ncbi:MAG: hypothetical protein Q9169_008154 [Polycauliona sp. 2 TL-2023]